MVEMKIEVLSNANPINNIPYKLAQKYKDIVKNEIDNMPKVFIIYLVDQSWWPISMVVQHKKHYPKNMRVCVYFIWLNKVTLTNPFPAPFAGEIINEVGGHEFYSFTYGFSLYNKVSIEKEDQQNTTFVCEFGGFS